MLVEVMSKTCTFCTGRGPEIINETSYSPQHLYSTFIAGVQNLCNLTNVLYPKFIECIKKKLKMTIYGQII